MRRTRFDAAIDKRDAVNSAEAAGQVADSLDVRMALVEQMNAGTKTLAEVQAELAAIKRNAKRNGKVTRSQAWSRG